MGPFAGVRGNDVDMVEKKKRRGWRSRNHARVERLPFRIRADQSRLDLLFPEQLLKVERAGGLVPWRVGRIDAKVTDQCIFGLAFDKIVGFGGGTATLQRG